jgi:hypothetical protein
MRTSAGLHAGRRTHGLLLGRSAAGDDNDGAALRVGAGVWHDSLAAKRSNDTRAQRQRPKVSAGRCWEEDIKQPTERCRAGEQQYSRRGLHRPRRVGAPALLFRTPALSMGAAPRSRTGGLTSRSP